MNVFFYSLFVRSMFMLVIEYMYVHNSSQHLRRMSFCEDFFIDVRVLAFAFVYRTFRSRTVKCAICY